MANILKSVINSIKLNRVPMWTWMGIPMGWGLHSPSPPHPRGWGIIFPHPRTHGDNWWGFPVPLGAGPHGDRGIPSPLPSLLNMSFFILYMFKPSNPYSFLKSSFSTPIYTHFPPHLFVYEQQTSIFWYCTIYTDHFLTN